MLKADSTRGQKLDVAPKFRSSLADGCIQRSRPQVQERQDTVRGLALKAEQQSIAQHATARMNGIPDNALADDIESLHGQSRLRRIPRNDPDLRLRIEHVDMRDIPGNGVFQPVSCLETQYQPALQFLGICAETEQCQRDGNKDVSADFTTVFKYRQQNCSNESQCVRAYMKKLTAIRKA